VRLVWGAVTPSRLASVALVAAVLTASLAGVTFSAAGVAAADDELTLVHEVDTGDELDDGSGGTVNGGSIVLEDWEEYQFDVNAMGSDSIRFKITGGSGQAYVVDVSTGKEIASTSLDRSEAIASSGSGREYILPVVDDPLDVEFHIVADGDVTIKWHEWTDSDADYLTDSEYWPENQSTSTPTPTEEPEEIGDDATPTEVPTESDDDDDVSGGDGWWQTSKNPQEAIKYAIVQPIAEAFRGLTGFILGLASFSWIPNLYADFYATLIGNVGAFFVNSTDAAAGPERVPAWGPFAFVGGMVFALGVGYAYIEAVSLFG
jgi:hypothetical protein